MRHGILRLQHRAWVASLGLAGAVALAAPAPAWAACSTAICSGGTSCTISGTHTIDHSCVLDWSGKTVTVAKGAKLTTASAGHGYTLLAATLVVRGELEAPDGSISVDVTNDFLVENFNNSAAAVDARDGGDIDVTAADQITLQGKQFSVAGSGGTDGGTITLDAGGATTVGQALDASGGGDFAFGGFVDILCGSLTTSALIDLHGTQGGDGGELAIDCGGAVSIGGNVDASGNGDFAFGGGIDITGSSIATTGQLKSTGDQEGDGGDLSLTATGLVDVDGNVNLSSSGEFAFGGFVGVDAGSFSTSSDWNTNGGSGGLGGDVDITVATTATTDNTSSWTCTAGGGGDGCFVTIAGGGLVTLNGDIDAGAGGTDASAGSIDVRTTGGDLTVGSTALLSADTGTGGFSGGTITLGSACDVDVNGTVDSVTAGVSGGDNTIIYRETLDVPGTVRGASNTIQCRCVDAGGDGTCDAPVRCTSNPNITGTVTPSATVTPAPFPACS